MGAPWPDEQFDELVALATELDRTGRRVILVEMAVAPWLRQRNSDFEAFKSKWDAYVPRLQKLQNVDLIRMAEFESNDTFDDGTHPRLKHRAEWASWLADQVAIRLKNG